MQKISHCEALQKPKQSTNETCESKANCELYANLWLDSKNNLLIHFWVINFYFLLDSRDLDCFDSLRESRNDKLMATRFIVFGLPRIYFVKSRNDNVECESSLRDFEKAEAIH